MSDRLSIQQALFGYREGHNLIASSVLLAPRVRHFLATVTDGSGSETAEGFDVAYTGLPVPDTDYYALFCTWLAPEMPRPGCVWSHALLLDLSDLARIPDLSSLRGLCLRPSALPNLSAYERPLIITTSDTAPGLKSPDDRARAACILPVLYGQSEKSLVILDESSCPWETTIFGLWSQQWPKLRRNFAFSTSSLGDRRLTGVAFDLQIAPLSTQRLWRRSGGPPTVVVEFSSSTPPLNAPTWLNSVLDDLIAGSVGPLRRFLFAYGSDIEKPRQTFARLVAAFEQLATSPNDNWTETLSCIAAIFPNESEALRLKEWLIAPQVNYSSVQDLERAWATASFLLSAREAQAFASISFDHAGLTPFLWVKKREEVLSLLKRLVRQPENPSAQAFATAVANSVQPRDLRFICEHQPELISFFIQHRPSLAFEAETWQLPEYIQWRIYEALDSLSLDSGDWGKIMAAMLLAATGVAVRDAVERAGKHAIESAFHWLRSPTAQEYLPSQIWREALATPAAIQLNDAKSLPPDQLALCVWFVLPKAAKQLLNASRQDVQGLAKQPLDAIPRPLQVPTAFLLVTLGLRANGPEGVRLIAQGFFRVHDALASTQYSSESWSLLSSELPRSPIWKEWDRCEKLRRAVRKYLLQHGGKSQLLEGAINSQNRELVRKILDDQIGTDGFID